MRIFHIALDSEWRAARRDGRYATSTLGRSLAEEGFIHCARRDQLAEVSRRFFGRERRPLVLLEIDTERLGVPWREDRVGDQTFPHVYGPIRPADVVSATPWHRGGRPRSFLEVFFGEMLARALPAAAAMALAVLGAAIAPADVAGAELTGALVGLGLGVAVFWYVVRRR